MTRNVLVIDIAIAVVLAAILLIASPGPAVDAILALILLLAVGIGRLVSRGSLRRAGRRRSSRSPGPSRRSGPRGGSGSPRRPAGR